MRIEKNRPNPVQTQCEFSVDRPCKSMVKGLASAHVSSQFIYMYTLNSGCVLCVTVEINAYDEPYVFWCQC